jgi:hypothetical protein
MKSIILASVSLLALVAAVPAHAASTVAVAGGFAGSAQTSTAHATTTGPAVAGAFTVQGQNTVGAGVAVATPAGGLSSGVGASQTINNGAAATFAAPGGTGTATFTNGAFACSHHGCGCRDVVYPVHVEQPYYEEQGNVLEV